MLRARLGLLRGSLLTVQHALTDLEACRTGSRNDPDGDEEDDEEGADPASGEGGSGEANAVGTPDRAITAKALRREIIDLDLTKDVRVRISALIDQLEAAGGAPTVEVLRPQLLALDKTSLDGSLRDEVTTELQNLERVAGLVAMAEAEPEQAGKDQRLAEAWTALPRLPRRLRAAVLRVRRPRARRPAARRPVRPGHLPDRRRAGAAVRPGEGVHLERLHDPVDERAA